MQILFKVAQFWMPFNNMTFSMANASEIYDLRSPIGALENELMAPQTHPVLVISSVYASEVPLKKSPLFALALGVFLVFLVAGVARVVPKIWRQLR